MQPPAETNWPTNRTEIPGRTVVLIGASIRSAAQSAKLASFRVLGIDQFGDIDTREACEHFWELDEFSSNPEFLTHCRRFPVLTVGGLNSHRSLVESLEKSCAAWPSAHSPSAHPPSARRWESRWDDPQWLADLSHACDLKFPTTLQMTDSADRPLSLEGGRWLRKSRNSSGGLGVRWNTACLPNATSLFNGNEIQETECRKPTTVDESATSGNHDPNAPPPNAVLQRWIAGRVHGATLICNGTDSRLLGVCRSLFTRKSGLPFVYRGSFGPVSLPTDLTSRLQRLGKRVVAETGWRGLLNIDFLIDRQGVAWILELNPRWSGSSEVIEQWMLERKQTTSLFGTVASAICGNSLESFDQCSAIHPSSAGHLYLKRIIFARRNVCFSRQQLMPIINQHDQLCDYPLDGSWIPKGNPICTLVSRVPRTEFNLQASSGTQKSPVLTHRASLLRLLETLER